MTTEPRTITLTIGPCEGISNRYRYHAVEINEDGFEDWILTIELMLDSERTWGRWGRVDNWCSTYPEMRFGEDAELLDVVLDELEDIRPRQVQIIRAEQGIVIVNTIQTN